MESITQSIKPKFAKAFMKVAETFAELSSAKRAQVGCIIVKDNRIISIGYNGMPSGWENECEEIETIPDNVDKRQEYIELGYTIEQQGDKIQWNKMRTKPEVLHAEANAITKVAQSNDNCKDAVLFCTHMPCIQCAKLIYQAGIKEVYYKITYDAAIGCGLEFLEDSGIKLTKMENYV